MQKAAASGWHSCHCMVACQDTAGFSHTVLHGDAQVLGFLLGWGKRCQKHCSVLSVERSWLVGLDRKATLPSRYQYRLHCLSSQQNPAGCFWLLLPPIPKHPVRKGSLGLCRNSEISAVIRCSLLGWSKWSKGLIEGTWIARGFCSVLCWLGN